ncbi:hypothetical protein [Zavarzinia sp. CC-PAN008]|uniref:hypothetical protein n=1 Tax=Zavarzinia sp. CC-PAN008 TaxID=3243332 RepID=UPI003F744978
MRTLIAGAVVAMAMIVGTSAQAGPIAPAPGALATPSTDRASAAGMAAQGGDLVAGVELVGDRHHRRHGRHWRDRRYGYYYPPPPPPRYYYAPPPPVYYAPPPPPPRYYYPSRPGGYFNFGFGGPL